MRLGRGLDASADLCRTHVGLHDGNRRLGGQSPHSPHRRARPVASDRHQSRVDEWPAWRSGAHQQQMEYYRVGASEYGVTSSPPGDRHRPGGRSRSHAGERAQEAIDGRPCQQDATMPRCARSRSSSPKQRRPPSRDGTSAGSKDGATEERPPWRYAELVAERIGAFRRKRRRRGLRPAAMSHCVRARQDDAVSAEEPLVGGNVTSVTRVGDTVRRSVGPWTPAVHELRTYLEALRFRYAPRVLGRCAGSRGRQLHPQGRPSVQPIPGPHGLGPTPRSSKPPASCGSITKL